MEGDDRKMGFSWPWVSRREHENLDRSFTALAVALCKRIAEIHALRAELQKYKRPRDKNGRFKKNIANLL